VVSAILTGRAEISEGLEASDLCLSGITDWLSSGELGRDQRGRVALKLVEKKKGFTELYH
jgi:hypothetical protein